MGAGTTIGMAVIGSSGHAARVSSPTIAGAHGARLVGVLGSSFERSQSLAIQYPGSRAYANWAELALDDDVQAVWVAGPNAQHAQFAEKCLRAGKHVYLEKPMATTQAAAEELRALADAEGLTLMVDFQHRFRPAHQWMRTAIQDGVVGAPRLLRIHRFWPYPYYADMPAEVSGSWRSSKESSGGWALNDIGSHLVDLALWLMGQKASLVFARTANYKFEQAGSEDTAILVLDTEDGATMIIETSNAMSSFPGTIEVHGLNGWLRADSTFDGGGAVLSHTGECKTFPEATAMDAYAAGFRDFLHGVAGSPISGATAADAVASIDIIERAAAQHRLK